MNPARLAEPQALAVVFTAIVLVAALLVLAVGAGNTLPAADEAPITRERPDRLPSVAEGEAATRACEEAGAWRLGECVISVLDNSGFDERLFQRGPLRREHHRRHQPHQRNLREHHLPRWHGGDQAPTPPV